MDQYELDNPNFINEVQDKRGYNLFHVLATTEKLSFQVAKSAIDLLNKYNVNPTKRSKAGQTPHALAQRDRQKDTRILRLIEDSVKLFQSQQPKTKKSKKKNKKKKKPAMGDMPDGKTTDDLSWSEAAEVAQHQAQEIVGTNGGENGEEMIEKNVTIAGKSDADLLRENISKAIDDLQLFLVSKVFRNESEDSKQENSAKVNESMLYGDGSAVASDVADGNDECKRPVAVNQVDYEIPADVEVDDAVDEGIDEELFGTLIKHAYLFCFPNEFGK